MSGPCSTENEAGRGNLRRHQAGQFRGRETVVASRGRTQQHGIGCQGRERVEEEASENVHSRIVRKVGICDRSEDAWGLATAYFLTGSVDTTNQRFEEELPSTAVVNMSGVSGGMSVSKVSAVQAGPSQPTLRVEALPPGSLSTKPVSLGSSNSTFHAEVQINGLTH